MDLTGQYLGQTKIKVGEKLGQAKGSVLFIDEAYELGKGPYGEEAMTTLLAAMTDPEYKGMVIIIAGYAKDIDLMLNRNEGFYYLIAGLKSRFTKFFEFKDWSSTHSAENLIEFAKKEGFRVDIKISEVLEKFERLIALPGWANGRDVNQIWTNTKRNRSSRVVDNHEPLRTIQVEEINKALDDMLKARIPPEGSTTIINTKQFDYSQCLTSGEPLHELKIDEIEEEKLDENVLHELKERLDDGENHEPISTDDFPEPDGFWNGMDVEKELRPLNDLLDSIKWISDEKINQLIDSGPESEDAQTLVNGLIKKGLSKSTARNIVNKWIEASEVQRKKRHAAEVQAKLLSRRPIIQCQVCKRTAYYWTPCPVAPMQIGWEDVNIPIFQARGVV